MDLEASSFAGITKSTAVGSELVSTNAKTGMFNFCASDTAMCSFFTSMTNKAPGKRVMSEIEPKFFSNFAL